MSRPMQKLSPLQISRAVKRQCSLNDGGGLYFISRPPNGASWMFRFNRHGKDRWMGIGQYPTVTLSDARQRATDARRLLIDDVDPINHRREQRSLARLEHAKRMTFAQCAAQYIASHKAAWRNSKHRAQWESTLATYAYPVIGSLPVAAIDTPLVMKVLQPIWTTKPETASRLRGRIEAILNWATASEFRTGPNPARWRGHLDNLLPAKSKIARVTHHAALPYTELPDFMAALRDQDGIAARALEFLILTAARTGEVIGARWSEINLSERLWTIPAERMKASKEHRVPLSPRAIEILETLRPTNAIQEAFVFPGSKPGKPLSNMAFLMLLRRMERSDLTAHGFRSTFRDWCAERTNFPNEVAEMALAHTVSNKVEAAYRRGDLFEKRCRLMDDWAIPELWPEIVEFQKQGFGVFLAVNEGDADVPFQLPDGRIKTPMVSDHNIKRVLGSLTHKWCDWHSPADFSDAEFQDALRRARETTWSDLDNEFGFAVKDQVACYFETCFEDECEYARKRKRHAA